MSIDELQSTVAHLPKRDLDQFVHWLESFLASEWDRQIEDDILAGRWDREADRAVADFESGKFTELAR